MFRAVKDPSTGRLRARVNAMSNRAALHENDRMVAILARHGRGQPEDISRLCPAGHKLKARRRQMVAFVNDKMTIVRHQVGYFALPHEALDQRDINDTGRLAAPAADDADILRIDIEKCLEAFHPLAEQLPTMDEHERIQAPLSNERCGHNRLAEGGRRREHAIVMRR